MMKRKIRVRRARLDAEGTAEPLTHLVGHYSGVGPQTVISPGRYGAHASLVRYGLRRGSQPGVKETLAKILMAAKRRKRRAKHKATR